MGRIFVGLAKSGAWGCFDEFNRLDENTLSTVSTLIQAIQSALKNKRDQVILLGHEVSSLSYELSVNQLHQFRYFNATLNFIELFLNF